MTSSYIAEENNQPAYLRFSSQYINVTSLTFSNGNKLKMFSAEFKFKQYKNANIANFVYRGKTRF